MAAVARRSISWVLAALWVFDAQERALGWEYQFKEGADKKQHIKPTSRCPFCRDVYRRRQAEIMARVRSRGLLGKPMHLSVGRGDARADV